MKRTPTGFVAICQCGELVGAADANRTERKELGRLLGQWLHNGCSVHPKFEGTWVAEVKPCRCNSRGGAIVSNKCPECGSERVYSEHRQLFMINSGDHHCHAMNPHDVDSPSGCLDRDWSGDLSQTEEQPHDSE